jgi:hypothetical protein
MRRLCAEETSMQFDKTRDKIAVTIPYFKLLSSSDGARRRNRFYNEPYIVSVAVDAQGKAAPALEFNTMPFPKVQKGEAVQMLGNGHLVYGPKHPGEFLALSILIMESDADIRARGEKLERFVQSKALELGLGAVMAANATAGSALAILKELTQFVAGRLKENGDDELLRTEGSFLRDDVVPYHINRRYQRTNDFIDVSVQIIPLDSSNGQGAAVRQISLK